MNQRIPTVLVPTLECYLSSMNEHLPGFLDSFYVLGSIALDEFSPHFSDVDFVAVISHPSHGDETWALEEIHREVERKYPRWKLSGMYLLETQLGRADDFLIYHDGFLTPHPSEPDPVTWWILKNHGIALLGSDPRDLPITVDANVLVTWTQENMNTYWKSWTRRPGRLILLLSDWGILWAVLGVARQFYTIREKRIISKRRAGDYALSVIPERWHRVIDEAIRIRTRSGEPLYRSRLVRMFDTVNFMKYIIRSLNDHPKAE
ncbi:MAG: DUF4111 domain-containing protein [Chloroflexi bacterium]|nr:MAG: DUF4111 domain-containing protein [Chloroflexota bacterium]